ncbi:aromatic ring-opening dioxygenase LigA [Actinoplanes sp. NBRC 101535]|uniref:aromatic ring-opening dioxygenase LigA n=1 Tax=Actinoplanes sp. NBRC 101535 TaxID=3032196 RepID=UPI0024A31209|nr:aromatic ring-opening dioxygenase LigA [Actinoplanes sp. NBRC 101535]GLY02813.1 hypothetical protein Acsp01_31920 [Actinoplanes sp. NBRC 101535]
MAQATAPTDTVSRIGRLVRLLSLAVAAAGVIMVVAGAATWFTVQGQLADEKITVSEDAGWLAGDDINGPFSAYQEAQVIEKHALAASGGKTYAELDKEDPKRETVMNGSFLRASLFTSVVSFGIAAMAAGLGVIFIMIGYALFLVARRLTTATPPAVES